MTKRPMWDDPRTFDARYREVPLSEAAQLMVRCSGKRLFAVEEYPDGFWLAGAAIHGPLFIFGEHFFEPAGADAFVAVGSEVTTRCPVHKGGHIVSATALRNQLELCRSGRRRKPRSVEISALGKGA